MDTLTSVNRNIAKVYEFKGRKRANRSHAYIARILKDGICAFL